MEKERYEELFEADAAFTSEEVAEGWHWCDQFDDLQVGPESDEWGLDKGRCCCGHCPPK